MQQRTDLGTHIRSSSAMDPRCCSKQCNAEDCKQCEDGDEQQQPRRRPASWKPRLGVRLRVRRRLIAGCAARRASSPHEKVVVSFLTECVAPDSNLIHDSLFYKTMIVDQLGNGSCIFRVPESLKPYALLTAIHVGREAQAGPSAAACTDMRQK